MFKKYIVPYLFGRRSRKTIDVRLNEVEKTVVDCVAQLAASMNKIREDIERGNERKGEVVNRQIEELKTEVTSLKKLLLNRKQFPTATVTGPLSIPAWQRAASPPEEKEAEEEGNGSGTNGSDSSLEMIKE
ncbi:hypothetical protein AAG570_009836 [Ranatra chinensis]|uniref:Uncharacterized protein n=1 Tax=Ranatra chinensis TaxID=642074 RepID=A0ABD0YQ79_9HEMI